MLPWQSSKSFGCVENELVAQLSPLGLPKRAELKTWLASQLRARDDFEDLDMTTPNERTRAVIQTGEFLLELSQDSSLPERIRRDAKFLLRHYPDQFQMLLAEQGSL
ncbi:BPSL0761 family protein, partial [Pseudomonas savastanoi]